MQSVDHALRDALCHPKNRAVGAFGHAGVAPTAALPLPKRIASARSTAGSMEGGAVILGGSVLQTP